MTTQEELIAKIDREYDRSEGFLGLLRAGVFDPEGASRLIDLLSSIDVGDGPIEKRLVQLLWYMPIFLQWQKERFVVHERDPEDVVSVMNEVVSTLERVLGVP